MIQSQDGKYRWTYSLDMLRNPVILAVVLKIFGILFSIPILISVIGAAIHNNWADAWQDNIRIWLIVLAVFLVITLVSYLIVAWMYGGKYIAHFTMDENCIVHEQEPTQFKRAQKIGVLTALVGIAAKRPATTGAGVLAASRSKSTSVFANVRRIKPRRAFNLIKVNQLLDRNQVYVPKEDFDFVLDFIRKHCPNAK